MENLHLPFWSSSRFYWKILQALVWIAGILLLFILIYKPRLGIALFWNGLIPIAPALLVLATGIWRNICPLATTAMFANRFNFSLNRKLSTEHQSAINLISVVVLFIIIPLRHVLFNTEGFATFFLLCGVSSIAFLIGMIFESKSGWCSGLCPVQPVEKLYGSSVSIQVPNVHCSTCVRCSIPCPDSTKNYLPLKTKKLPMSGIIEFLMAGAFPGYIWGWFQVPDYFNNEGWLHLGSVYAFPIMGAMISGAFYLVVRKRISQINRREVIAIFSAAAVSCYYWFRLPMLVGFGSTASNGMLIDLSGKIPFWSIMTVQLVTTTFFFWWIVWRNKVKRSWTTRPEYAKK